MSTLISSLSEYVDFVVELCDRWAPVSLRSDPGIYRSSVDLWFRGANDQRWPLIPASYRPARLGRYNELDAVTEFKTVAVSILDREPHDEWAWYFLMQHHGLPTRLLDWSESPLVALFFALDGFNPAQHDLPCVWIIDPRVINRASSPAYELISLLPDGAFSSHWLPSRLSTKSQISHFDYEGHSYNNELPIAVLPRRREARLLAQRGAFTVHGVQAESLKGLMEEHAGENDEPRVSKLFIDPDHTLTILNQLSLFGIRRSTLFPEPQTLARELALKFMNG